jgi:hypothetical protein
MTISCKNPQSLCNVQPLYLNFCLDLIRYTVIDGNKSLYLVFVGVIFFSQHLGLLLEQLGQHLRLLLEQLGQHHLDCFVRTAGQQHLDCF